MTNPMINPQPNYSGVTIQISNPAVYTGNSQRENQGMIASNQIPCDNRYCIEEPRTQQMQALPYATSPAYQPVYPQSIPQNVQSQSPIAYPPQYYLNNYNYQNNGEGVQQLKEKDSKDGEVKKLDNLDVTNSISEKQANLSDANLQRQIEQNVEPQDVNNAKMNSYRQPIADEKPVDMSKSNGIINDLDERNAQIQEEKKNTKQKRVVALTDEYIKSLENYLNNPNDEIRLMASKEILTRLDEDKDRYTDAALNALLNKMLQDPSKLIRISALSAFASQLASGNDYTVTLLQNIQQNPNADKEDVLQAADILLKMSAGTEVRNIPNPKVKETKEGK